MAQGGVACGVLTLLLTVIVCLPIVLILRVDGTVTWSWLLVFIPFWLVNALLSLTVTLTLTLSLTLTLILPEPVSNPNPNLSPNPKPNPIPNQVNALLCVAIFGRPCFAARAEDAKARP